MMNSKKTYIGIILVILIIISAYSVVGAQSKLIMYLCLPEGPNGEIPGPCDVLPSTPWTYIVQGSTVQVSTSGIPSPEIPRSCSQEGWYVIDLVDDAGSTTKNAYNIQWDNEQEHCECLDYVEGKSTSWNTDGYNGAKCCGDDGDVDSGLRTSEEPSKYTCLVKKKGGNEDWLWRNRLNTQNVGSVYKITNNRPNGYDFTVVSNKDNWIACVTDTNSISGHNFNPSEAELRGKGGVVQQNEANGLKNSFICTNRTVEGVTMDVFVECAAAGSFNTGTIKVPAGVGAELEGHYCSNRGDWIGDLNDDPSGQTCESAGFEWTGSHCCGVTKSGMGDNYNDKFWRESQPGWYSGFYQSKVGSCFGNKRVINNTRVADTSIMRSSSPGKYTWIGGEPYENGVVLEATEEAYQDISYKLYPSSGADGEKYILSGDIAGMGTLGSNPSYIAVRSGTTEIVKIMPGEGPKEFTVTPSQAQNLHIVLISRKPSAPITQTFFTNINLVMKSKKLMSLDGNLYGCKVGKEYYDTLTKQNDLVVEDFDQACVVKGDFFCLEDGWHDEDTSDMDGLIIKSYERNWSSTLPNGTIGCCPPNHCFNGNKCVPGEVDINNIDYQIDYEGKEYICVGGNWVESEERRDIQGRKGYCPEEPQCLFDLYGSSVEEIGRSNQIDINQPDKEILKQSDRMNDMEMLRGFYGFGSENSKSQNPRCVPEGTIVGDYKCKNHTWTTRTKELAMAMVRHAGGNDFTLYCDYWRRVLPYAENIPEDQITDYVSGTRGGNIFDIVDEENSLCGSDTKESYPCTNHYCLLTYKDGDESKSLIGTTLNKKVDDEDHSFIYGVLNQRQDTCNHISAEGFHPCTTDKTVWFNPELNSIIYSVDSISSIPNQPSEEQGIFDDLVDSMKNILENLKRDDYFDLEYPWQPEQDFSDQMTRLNKIYITRKGSQRIFAGSETIGEVDGKPTLTVEYPESITEKGDVCNSIHRLTEEQELKKIDCIQEGTQIQITSTDAETINAYWQGLTSSLRLEGD